MAVVGGGENFETHNLRDFLSIKDDDRRRNLTPSTSSNGVGGRHNSSGLTLNAILSEKRAPPPHRPADEPPLQSIQSNRTLLDIIREDQTSGLVGERRDGRMSWRQLREKIRLRTSSGGSALSSTVPVPTSDVPINNNYDNRTIMMMTRRPSIRLDPIVESAGSTQLSPSPYHANGRFEHNNSLGRRRLIGDGNHRRLEDDEDEDERAAAAAAVEGEGDAAEQPVRVSLMALLAENDRQMGLDGSAYVMDDDEEDVPAEEIGGDGGGGGYNSCCVCMLRHKGAAFIPCGHTFCRLCSRELWVQRGNCPLCNNYILEILDIF